MLLVFDINLQTKQQLHEKLSEIEGKVAAADTAEQLDLAHKKLYGDAIGLIEQRMSELKKR